MKTIIATVCALAFATPAFAETPKPVQQNNSNAVWFENWKGLSNATMTVAQPNGEIVSLFAAKGTPVFELKGREVVDGVYRFEITAATEERVKIVNKLNNGRGDAARDTVAKSYQLAGQFHVQRGVIVVPKDVKEE